MPKASDTHTSARTILVLQEFVLSVPSQTILLVTVVLTVKYPASARLQVDFSMCLVIHDKHEQMIVTCAHCLHCESAEISI